MKTTVTPPTGVYGVWRVAVDYMKGDEPAVRAGSVETAIRRANEPFPGAAERT